MDWTAMGFPPADFEVSDFNFFGAAPMHYSLYFNED